jgi:hypothetical protein
LVLFGSLEESWQYTRELSARIELPPFGAFNNILDTCDPRA